MSESSVANKTNNYLMGEYDGLNGIYPRFIERNYVLGYQAGQHKRHCLIHQEEF